MGSASGLQIDIDGTIAGNGAGYYSQVKGTGTASVSVNGTLQPNLGTDISWCCGAGPAGFRNPSIGTMFTIISTEMALGVSGAFTGLSIGSGTSASLSPNTTFSVAYNPNAVVPVSYTHLTLPTIYSV